MITSPFSKSIREKVQVIPRAFARADALFIMWKTIVPRKLWEAEYEKKNNEFLSGGLDVCNDSL